MSSIDELFAQLERESKMLRYAPRRWYYALYRKAAWLSTRPRALKYAYQRARRGYSTQDTWGFDTYLSGVIAGGITELRDRDIGHPSSLCGTGLGCSEGCDGPDVWKAILADIIDGFDLSNREWELSIEEREQARIKTNRAHDLLKEHWSSLWD